MGSGVHSLGYFLFEVSDLEAWDHFLTEVVGVERGQTLVEGLVPYRTDERAARILLREGPADDLVALGFEVPTETALAEVSARVGKAGYAIEPSSTGEARGRGVAGFARTFEPGGVAIEIFYGPVIAETPFRRDVVATGFVTGEQGVGHGQHRRAVSLRVQRRAGRQPEWGVRRSPSSRLCPSLWTSLKGPFDRAGF